jgi:5'-deoxynucleotidase YfbR-like HD superfamily hydrolase
LSLYTTGELPADLLTTEDRKLCRLIKGCKGVAQLLYLANRSEKVRDQALKRIDLNKEIFEEKYLEYILENKTLNEIYKKLCSLIFKEKAGTEQRLIKTKEISEMPAAVSDILKGGRNAMRAWFLAKRFLGDKNLNPYLHIFNRKAETKYDIWNEVGYFKNLLRMKRNYTFGAGIKNVNEHRDSDAEHTFFMEILVMYFANLAWNDQRQNEKEKLYVPEIKLECLVHDGGEYLKGDKRKGTKTTGDENEEKESWLKLYKNYLPRMGGFRDKIFQAMERYENGKVAEKLEIGPATFVKAIDILEALIYILDQETVPKQVNMRIVDFEKLYQKSKGYFDLYPIMDDFILVIIKQYKLANNIY